MSYQSLFKTISEKLTQPSGVAVMASIGIHLILGATLPYLLPALSREDEAESRRTVELLELNPEDLGNLPAIASPLDLPPLPPLPENFDPEQFQSLPPLPSDLSTPLSQLPEPSVSSRYKFPLVPLPSLRPSQRLARRSIPLPSTSRATQPQLQDESLPPEESQAETPETEYEIAKNSGVQIPVFRTAPPGIIPSNVAPPEESDTEPRARGNSGEPSEANENAEPPVDPAQLYARHREQVLAQRVKELQRRRAALRRSNENTSDEAARRNLTAWAAEQARQENEETQERFTSWIKELRNGQAPKLNFTPSYPKEACVQKLEGQTLVGALLNPNGSVAESPVLIRSSGYPLFDQKALEAVQSRRFSNETGQKQPYLVDVTFKYNEETCPDLSVPEESAAEQPEPSTEESPEPSTEESPAPSAQESPEPSTEESPEPSAEQSPEPSTEQSVEQSTEEPPEPSAEESPEPSAEETPASSTEEATEETGTPAAESTGDESEESANSATSKPAPAPSEEKANL